MFDEILDLTHTVDIAYARAAGSRIAPLPLEQRHAATGEERRLQTGLEVRAGLEDAAPPMLRGYAAVFGEETVIGDMFREVLEPGAFDDALGDDVRALVNHDPSLVLGRTRAGTLRLSVDARGLAYEVDLPRTSYADDLRESVSRGDVSQSSFGFRVVDDTWERATRAGELPLRRVRKVELFDVSPVTYPAYASTSVSTRAQDAAAQHRGGQVADPNAVAAEWERMRHASL